MKKVLPIIMIFFILILSTSLAFSQKKSDLTGTWKGSTFVNGPEIDLVLTLVLEQKADVITGKLNDDLGYINSPITEVKLKNNVLTFKSIAQTPDGDVEMTFEMAVTKETLDGTWKAGDEAYGDWTAKKVKEVKVSLTGTWVGPAETPDGEDLITFVLTLTGNKVSGTLSDEFGFFNKTPIKNGKFEKNKISFESIVSTPDGELNVVMEGTVTGNTMKGIWELVETGETGSWSAKKK